MKSCVKPVGIVGACIKPCRYLFQRYVSALHILCAVAAHRNPTFTHKCKPHVLNMVNSLVETQGQHNCQQRLSVEIQLHNLYKASQKGLRPTSVVILVCCVSHDQHVPQSSSYSELPLVLVVQAEVARRLSSLQQELQSITARPDLDPPQQKQAMRDR